MVKTVAVTDARDRLTHTHKSVPRFSGNKTTKKSYDCHMTAPAMESLVCSSTISGTVAEVPNFLAS